MPENRPFVLTIAGFDPSGGAGVLADIKTFEQHHVYGFAVNVGNTIQTEKEFFEMHWTDQAFVLRSLDKLFENYSIKAVKNWNCSFSRLFKENCFIGKKAFAKNKDRLGYRYKIYNRILFYNYRQSNCFD